MNKFNHFRKIVEREYHNLLKSVKVKNSFVQNFTYVLSSKVLILIIGFFLTPILTRIYDAEAYGNFSFFNSIVNIGSLLALCSLHVFFTLPKKYEDFKALVSTTFFLVTLMSVVSSVTLYFFGSNIISFFEVKDFDYYELFIVLGIFIFSINQILRFWLIRENEFRKSSLIGLATGPSSKVFAISIGQLHVFKSTGLILTELIFKVINGFFFLKLLGIDKLKEVISGFRITFLKRTYRRYVKNASIVISSSFFDLMTSNLPALLITSFFGSRVLGFYALNMSILYIPLKLIGEGGIGPLMLKKVSDIRNSTDAINCKEQIQPIANRSLIYLTILGFIPFIIVSLYGETIYRFLFGADWSQAGIIGGLLSILFYFRLINTISSSLIRVFELEKFNLFLKIILFLSTVLSLGIGHFYDSYQLAFFTMSILSAICYLVYMIILYRKVNIFSKGLFGLMFIIQVLFFIIALTKF